MDLDATVLDILRAIGMLVNVLNVDIALKNIEK